MQAYLAQKGHCVKTLCRVLHVITQLQGSGHFKGELLVIAQGPSFVVGLSFKSQEFGIEKRGEKL